MVGPLSGCFDSVAVTNPTDDGPTAWGRKGTFRCGFIHPVRTLGLQPEHLPSQLPPSKDGDQVTALMLLLCSIFQPIVAPCPVGVTSYEVNEPISVGVWCDTGSEGPGLGFTKDAEGIWHLEVR